MSGRKCIVPNCKLEIVQRYLKGNIGLKQFSSRTSYLFKSLNSKMACTYREHGVSGVCTTSGTYSGDFKIAVVEYMHTTGASMRQTAAHFKVPSKESVAKWERIYYEEGKDACMRKEEVGHLKWKQTSTSAKQKIRIKTKICLQKYSDFAWRTNT